MSNISGKIEPMEIHELIGAGVRAARERLGWRQEDAAREFRRHGLTTWRRSTVADVEAGRRHPSIGDLVLVATALEVTLADLIPPATERVDVGTGASVTAPYVYALLSGDLDRIDTLPVEDLPHIPGDGAQQEASSEHVRPQGRIVRTDPLIAPLLDAAAHRIKAADVQRAYESVPTDAEGRAANRLGVKPIVLKIASLALWGRSFEAERDARANASSGDAPSVIQARRGHSARRMLTELGTFIHLAHQHDEGKQTDASDQDD